MADLDECIRQEYTLRLKADRLRREAFQTEGGQAGDALLEELSAVEAQLAVAEEKRAAAQAGTPTGTILDTAGKTTRRGQETTGLEVKVFLNLAQVPTAIYHLLDKERSPLVTCEVKAVKAQAGGPVKRRVRVTSYIEGYSARAVNTFEIKIGETYTFKQLPTLFSDRLRDLTELTRATLNIEVEDLDGKVELHETEPVWLLARTSAPLSVRDPQTGKWTDLSPYFGAFVTPNAPSLMSFLRIAARNHPQGRLVGYQGQPEGVTAQVQALYDALKMTADITYVNSLISFSPDQGTATQRVRLPRESLADHQANCIDGTVLCASLLEAISLNPALVLVPGHAFLAWQAWDGQEPWHYLETTMIGTSTFQEAWDYGEKEALFYTGKKQLKMYPIPMLRTELGILPME